MPTLVLLAAGDRRLWEEHDRLLCDLGLTVQHVETGRAALWLHEQMAPRLTLIATDLPDLHALDLCRRLRRRSNRQLIVLAEATEDVDRTLAFEIGADDIIDEGCRIDELRERIDAALCRSDDSRLGREPGEVLDFGRIVLDRRSRLLSVEDRSCTLTRMECDLLWALGQYAGQVVASEHLLETVWGYPSGIKTRTLDVHIGRLRRKLGEDGKNPRYITTVRAVGFRFDPREALSAGGEAAA